MAEETKDKEVASEPIADTLQNQGETRKPTEEPKKKSKKSCAWLIVIAILLVGFYIMNFFGGPGAMVSMLGDYSDQEKQALLDKIVESTKPAPARDYNYPTPSKEALARNVDCSQINSYPKNLKATNPLCLNLYKTSAADIDSKLAAGNYDRVLLYGEKLIWDTPTKFPDSDKKLGSQIYNSAKFNDGIMLPALMTLFGVKDLSFIPSVISPYPAIYYRLSTLEEIRQVCANENADAMSCATLPWTSMIRESAMSDEPLSLINQKIFTIAPDGDDIKYKDRNYIEFDISHPVNCSTEAPVLHETAHNLLWITGVGTKGIGITNAPKFFNEHQAGMVERMAMDLVCGAGTRSNFRGKVDKKDVSYDIPHFSGLYPPTSLSSEHPTKDQTCKRAILSEWSRYLDAGNWQTQFANFFTALRKDSITLDLRSDNAFAGFLLRLQDNSPAVKDFLTSKGCQI